MKATKIDKILTIDLTLCSKCQINGEDFVNFCDLRGKPKPKVIIQGFLKEKVSVLF